jgi:hypothetical protein
MKGRLEQMVTSDLVLTMGWAGLKLAVVLTVALYTGMVLTSYSTQGPRYRLKLDPTRPARSVERLAVWLGVRTLATAAHAAKAVYDTLAETSADVGEWFIRRQGPDAEARFHARFL